MVAITWGVVTHAQVRRRSPEGWLICRAFSENGEIAWSLRLCCGCFGCCADAYAAGSEGLSVGQSYTWLLQEDHVFGTSADEEISEKIGSSVNSNSGGGGGSSSNNNSGGSSSISGSLKKRFSLFNIDAGAGKEAAGDRKSVV